MSNPQKIEHNPGQFYTQPEEPIDGSSEVFELKGIGAVNELIRQIRKMESIIIYDANNSIDIKRTKEERIKVIESQELNKITELDGNYRIVEDESGLPVLEVR